MFAYILTEKKVLDHRKILIITISGALTSENAAPGFEGLIRDVQRRSAHWFFLELQYVPAKLERSIIPFFAKLQEVIRDKNALLRICSIHPELESAFSQAGILREGESHKTVADALQALTLREKSP